MAYLRINNWEKFQNYSDRKPPWIRLYVDLINGDHAEYNELPDALKLQLIHLWMLASRHENKIPEKIVTRQRLNLKSAVNVDALIAAGFIERLQDASTEQADCNPRVRGRESVSVSGTPSDSGLDVDAAFEELWRRYPRRIGRKAALRAFRNSVKTFERVVEINRALENYITYTQTIDEKYIKHGSTWFGEWADWLDWTPPVAKPTSPDGLVVAETAKDKLRYRIDDFIGRHGVRPSDLHVQKRADWDTHFEIEMGFRPEEWADSTAEQCEAWLAALKVTA